MTAQKPASLKEIAEHLGLSKAAISRVLNGAPAAKSIPKATQERIFAAARQLNYRPNVLARSLRRGQSMTVGVMLPEISAGYTTTVLAGMEEGLLRAGYFFILMSHHHRAELVRDAEAMLRERSIDGLVAIDTLLDDSPRLPTVTVSCPAKIPGATNIVLNHVRAAELAVTHLRGSGHRRIAVIRGQRFSSDAGPRWQALEAAMVAAGVRPERNLVVELEGDEPTNEPGYFAAQRLLAAELPFTAVIAFNDVSAIGAVRALREAGLRVPQDVSVMGFDDIPSAAFQNPGLTTVRQPLRTMGLLAAEHLLKHIADPASAHGTRTLVVDPELVVRESTAAAAVAEVKKVKATRQARRS